KFGFRVRGLRIVETHMLDESAVARAARIGRHNREKRALLGTAPRQPDHNHSESVPQRTSAHIRATHNCIKGRASRQASVQAASHVWPFEAPCRAPCDTVYLYSTVHHRHDATHRP